MSANVDLSALPAPTVIESLSYEAILAERKAYFISLHPADEQPAVAAKLALESEPIVKLLEENAYRELVLRTRYNDEAKSLLLAYAQGADLDHIGVTYYDEARLTVTEADTTAIPPVAAVMESDSDFKYRLTLKPESYSVAGPTGAYEFHALSASGQVKKAKATSPEPGTSVVYVLSRSGDGTPSADILAAVETALDSETIRPMSEDVVVAAPEIIPYAIAVQLTLYPGASGETALATAEEKLATYAAQAHALDYDINRAAITTAAHVAGVQNTAVVHPAADLIIGKGQAGYCTGITVSIAGTAT